MNTYSGVRTITGIKVAQSDAAANFAQSRIRVDWTNSAGEQEFIERHGPAAQVIIGDLNAVTANGEASRQAYLIGFIRCHSLQRDSD